MRTPEAARGSEGQPSAVCEEMRLGLLRPLPQDSGFGAVQARVDASPQEKRRGPGREQVGALEGDDLRNAGKWGCT